MAKNLRTKIPASDTLVIRDIDSNIMKKFVDDVKSSSSETLNVELASNAREVAEKSVSCTPPLYAGVYSSTIEETKKRDHPHIIYPIFFV